VEAWTRALRIRSVSIRLFYVLEKVTMVKLRLLEKIENFP
jgi:hypothetical protein